MANMMEAGVDMLRAKLFDNAGSAIRVVRGDTVLFDTTAVKASSAFDDVDATGRRVTVYSVDFLISGATECIPDAKKYTPKSGDKISLIEALGEQVFTGYDDSDGAAAAILVDAVADVRIYDPGGNEVAAELSREGVLTGAAPSRARILSSYIVKPIVNELWRNDDPYGKIMRIHTQQLL